MNKQPDLYGLAARLEKFGDELLTLCERHEAIKNRIDVCAQISAVCRIVATLKALRAEERLADYASEFAAPRRAAGTERPTPPLMIPAGPILPTSDLSSTLVFATERGGPFTADAINRLIKRIGAHTPAATPWPMKATTRGGSRTGSAIDRSRTRRAARN